MNNEINIDRNLYGDVVSAKVTSSQTRNLSEGDLEFKIKKGSFMEGSDNSTFKFGTITFLENGKKFASITTSINALRGLVTIESESENSNSTLTLDLLNLTSDGKAILTGNINGKQIQGKIDPNSGNFQELKQDTRSLNLTNMFSVKVMEKISQFQNVLFNIAQVQGEREIKNTIQFNITPERNLLSVALESAAPYLSIYKNNNRDIPDQMIRNDRFLSELIAAVSPSVVGLVSNYASQKLGETAGNLIASIAGEVLGAAVKATAKP